ncbi:HEAT repeat domain-containing protein [Oscillatoria sp. FACHB-1406]|uniref:HEAT repeat domain-containing protein n=1 Tax=Oscillatoria sp. FACHB-1406 TaxID=2692846 RepID=UPI001685CF33|nr:HEAT repeat domain-containing protein [Oscillatoria sp. FACHB-1406]MBD2577375.1 HEAT repeat domain-containing protein [Oscillatoria sp. FACHB-1406]
MLDPITLAVGAIIADLGKGAIEDYVKDFFKDRIKDAESLAAKPFAKDAVKEAMGAFCTAFLEELQRQGLQGDTFSHYKKPLSKFIRLKPVCQALSRVFPPKSSRLDLKVLRESWAELKNAPSPSISRRIAPQKLQEKAPLLFRDLNPKPEVPALPEGFNWQNVERQYRDRVEAIVFKNRELREQLDSDNRLTVAKNSRATAGIIPSFDLAKYAETIKERYANLKLESLEATGYAYNELKLWQMFVPQNVRECREYLPQVYELPKELQRQLAERGELEKELSLEQLKRHQESYRQQSIQSVKELLADSRYSYLVILGDPGSGKSTLLQYIALEWAEHKIEELPNLPVPLLIELRTYIRSREKGECKNFLEFVNHSSGWVNHLNQHQLVEELTAGNAIILFDGLDEIFDRSLREDVVNQIHNFTQAYDKVRAIVTSRVIGYKAQRLRDAGFSHFLLQDLENEQIEDFIQRWHERTYPSWEERQRKQERFVKAIKTSKAIRELAGNPLLLTMMAILNRGRELPRDREQLYAQASQLLLHQWDIERQLIDQKLDPMAIDFRDKQAMLRRVARMLQTSEKGLAGNIIAVQQLEAAIEEFLKEKEIKDARTVARLLVQQLRERNFILCSLGSDYYAFVHRTFLEYFCAWDLVWEFKETRTLTLEQLRAEVFGQHWRDEAWQEVLRLICAMLDARFVGEILEDLLQREEEEFKNVFFAASCLQEVRERGKIAAIDGKVRERVISLISYDLPYAYEEWYKKALKVAMIRAQAVKTVATTWQDHSDTLHILKQRATTDEDEFVRYAAIKTLAQHYREDSDTLSLLKQRATTDESGNVRQAAVEALAQYYPDDRDTLPILKQRATTDEEAYVQQAAVTVLAQYYPDDSDTLPWLKQRATTDEHWNVRQAAVTVLAQYYPDDSDTLPWLKQRSTTDEEAYVRGAAVEALAQHYPDDSDTLPWLKQRATTDEHWNVRRAAVSALARHYRDDSDTLPWLKQRATTDEYWYVRWTAVTALAQHYRDDSDTLPILKQRATTDEDETVREAAVSALAQHYRDDSDTLPILKQRATTDEDETVRQAAVSALAQHYRDDSDTLPWLKQRATTDEHGSVRRAAVEALAQHYRDDSDTLPILKQCATTDEHWYVRRTAMEALAQHYRDDGETFAILCACALHDPFIREQDRQTNPRQVALKNLVKWVKFGEENPERKERVLAILQDRAANDADEQFRVWAQQELAKW